jgi:hypothetical protein
MIGPSQKPIDLIDLIASAPKDTCNPEATDQHTTGADSPALLLRAVEAPSSWHEHAVSDDGLQQLETNPHAPQREGEARARVDESEPSFRMSEGALSRLEAGLRAQEKSQTCRAGQFPPLVESEGSNDGSRQARDRLLFQPSPPSRRAVYSRKRR